MLFWNRHKKNAEERSADSASKIYVPAAQGRMRMRSRPMTLSAGYRLSLIPI